jgi:hypothetical protein
MITYSREWAMPNKWTFIIPPIASLLAKYVGNGQGWIDPFAGQHSPAEITNDLNPTAKTMYHLEAREFCKQLKDKYNGCLFDPPYSPRQIKEVYNSIGKANSFENTQASFWSVPKDIIAPKIKQKGLVICCGWSSGGFGKTRGFELIEVLLVPHGGAHNDTIVTVERKLSDHLF